MWRANAITIHVPRAIQSHGAKWKLYSLFSCGLSACIFAWHIWNDYCARADGRIKFKTATMLQSSSTTASRHWKTVEWCTHTHTQPSTSEKWQAIIIMIVCHCGRWFVWETIHAIITAYWIIRKWYVHDDVKLLAAHGQHIANEMKIDKFNGLSVCVCVRARDWVSAAICYANSNGSKRRKMKMTQRRSRACIYFHSLCSRPTVCLDIQIGMNLPPLR